jgi:TRAP-type mannitol/chloroaromatic compound transport system permease small subunit
VALLPAFGQRLTPPPGAVHRTVDDVPRFGLADCTVQLHRQPTSTCIGFDIMFEKLDQYLEIFSTTVMIITMSVATLVAFINVVLRYGFNFSLPWAGELTSYLFIWSALFGAAYGFKIGMHLGVTILIQTLKPRLAKRVLTFALVVILSYLLALIK